MEGNTISGMTEFWGALGPKALLGLAVSGILLVVGFTGLVPKRWYPAIAVVLSVFGNVFMEAQVSVSVVLMGVVVGVATIGGHKAFKETFLRRAGSPDTDHFIKNLSLVGVALVFVGCGTLTTEQRDISYEQGVVSRELVTKNKVRTFWDSKSALTAFNSLQTDKSQTTKIGSLNQESSATNVIALTEAVVEAAVRGAVKSVAPTK